MNTMMIALGLLLLLYPVASQTDQPQFVEPQCPFRAMIIDPPPPEDRYVSFKQLKEQLAGSIHDGNSIVTLQLLFHCAKQHCCNATTYLRLDKPNDLDALESVFVLSSQDWSNVLLPINPSYVLDAGAYVGYSAVFFAQMFPEARIISIEPNLDSFTMLRKNTMALPNVHPVRAGIWHKRATFEPFNDRVTQGQFLLKERTHSDPAAGAADIITRFTHAMTIPDLLQLFNIPHVDIAKIDLEGAESKVLAPTAPLGWLKNTSIVIAELHDRAATAFNMPQVSGPVVTTMRQHGFVVHHAAEHTYFVKEALAQHVRAAARGAHVLEQKGMGDSGAASDGVQYQVGGS